MQCIHCFHLQHHIYDVSVNWVIIQSNGLLPFWRQANTFTYADLCQIKLYKHNGMIRLNVPYVYVFKLGVRCLEAYVYKLSIELASRTYYY